ncbi:MAG: acyltransferase family protein [Deltaproteobacteria bacterium]|nr:acyltransferase family protein [Deltaproteobacteria bacterium]MCB9788129.1 acyltransferase family protein [Deltaproteobacteria bacterium]
MTASPVDSPRPGAARSTDPQLGDLTDAPFELFESERDVLSLDIIGEALRRMGQSVGLDELVRIIDEMGAARVREALSRILFQPADRVVDPFGLDVEFYDAVFPLVRWVHDHWFRVESTGLEHIPDAGRALIVANHSGTIPIDGLMVVTTARLNHPSHRRLRALVENFVYHMPWVGALFARGGAVRACQENATALLEADEAVLVFPEGVKGIGKLYKKRYRLQRFGRGGAIKLALSTGAPIVPCAIVGAEEAMPLIGKVSWLARPLGIPYIPVTPLTPLLGPLGLIPFPTKWFIDFGEPIDVTEAGADAVHDRVLVNRLNERVRREVQSLIDRRLAARRSIFFG